MEIPSTLPTTSTKLDSSKSDQQKTQFLQLLVAQLKSQNPLDPKDGTEFVAQLAQFSSLEELVNIRTVLENVHKTLEKPEEETSDPNNPLSS
jgi:flagellar basal-body rod modification protein FlgD